MDFPLALLSVVSGTVAGVSIVYIVHRRLDYHGPVEGLLSFSAFYLLAPFMKKAFGFTDLFDDAGLILTLTPFVFWIGKKMDVEKELGGK